MRSNTKLSKEAKKQFKNLCEANPDIQMMNLDNKSVMAYKLCGNTVQFALAVMSPDEKKFRPNVGKYLAINKFLLGQIVSMDKFDFNWMCESVWDAYPEVD